MNIIHNDNHQWITGEFDETYGCTCQVEEKEVEELSNCCGAPIISGTFCADCKEHCK